MVGESEKREELGPFAFDAPRAWARSSMVLLAGPGEGDASQPVIRLMRDPRSAGEPVHAYAWRRMFAMLHADRSLELLGSRDADIAGRPALQAIVRRTGEREDDVEDEAIAWICAGDGSVLVATCRFAPGAPAASTFQEMLASMKFQRRSA